MHPLLAIIKKEWLAMSHDVLGLLLVFAMPAAFILIMSLALRDTFRPETLTPPRWAFWDGDNTKESAAFLADLPRPDGAAPAAWKSSADLESAVARGDVQIGVFVKPGFSLVLGEMDADAKTKQSGPAVSIVAEPGLPVAIKSPFDAEAARKLSLLRMRELMRDMWPQDANGIDLTPENVGGFSLVETRYAQPPENRAAITSVQQSVPAWLVFGMFFVIVPLANIFIEEKQQGTLPRLRTLRVPARLIIAGKVFSFYIVNLVQTALMLFIGRCIVPLCGGDALSLNVNWLALWMIASATSLAAIGFALVMAAFVRTIQQAAGIAVVILVVFAAVGGVMVPKMVMPAAMQTFTVVSPMSWGLDGFLGVFARGATPATVLPPSLALLVFAAAALCVAGLRLKKGSG